MPEEEVIDEEPTGFEELSYNDLSEELLYELCLERNIAVTKEMTKDELIKCLKEDDKEDEI